MPFSDPLADGPVIQRATERALAAGGSLRTALAMIAGVRPQIAAPIVVFSYANPLLRHGLDAFARQAAGGRRGRRAGARSADRRGGTVSRDARGRRPRHDLSAEPDDDGRADSEGGGAGQRVSVRDLAAGRHRRARPGGRRAPKRWSRRIRAHTSLPIALGFGISRPEHVAEVGAYADAAVVGSALVSLIARGRRDRRTCVERVENYVRWLKGSTRRSDAHA